MESLQAEADFSREQLANMKQRQGGDDSSIDASDKENGVLGTSPPTIQKESQGNNSSINYFCAFNHHKINLSKTKKVRREHSLYNLLQSYYQSHACGIYGGKRDLPCSFLS